MSPRARAAIRGLIESFHEPAWSGIVPPSPTGGNMSDQADGLRELVRARSGSTALAEPPSGAAAA